MIQNVYFRTNGGGVIAALDREITNDDLAQIGLEKASPSDSDVGSIAATPGLDELSRIGISCARIDVPEDFSFEKYRVYSGSDGSFRFIPIYLDLVIHDGSTGLVKYTVNHPVHDGMISGAISAGEKFCFGETSGKEITSLYVSDGLLIARSEIPLVCASTRIASGGEEEATISNIPKGTVVYSDGEKLGMIDDGEFVFSASHSGTYRLVFSNEPYFDTVIEIEAS